MKTGKAKWVVSGLVAAFSCAAFAKEVIWTGSTGEDGTAWNLESANWRVEGSDEAVNFESGDRALFLDGAVSRTVTNALESFDVSGIVFSNATDALVWTPSSWNQNKTKLGGAFDKFGAGKLTVNGRFDALTNDFTVHAGRFVAAAGSTYAGEYYSTVGSLHDNRTVSFLTNATLEVTANCVFGSLGSAESVRFLFDHATIEFNRSDLVHHFASTTFRDARFTYSRPAKQMLFTYDQSFSGTQPYVIGSAGTDTASYGTVFNAGVPPETAQSEVFVDEITGDAGDDVTVASPLIDISTGRESIGCCGVTAFRKTGPGTMCLASGYGSTTGIVQVAEGTLRVAAGTDYADGRTALGKIDPALKRTVSAFGDTAILRLDSPLGPRHYVRNWELSVADGARVVLGDDLPYLQFGELSLSSGYIDYSRLGGFGVTRRLALAGASPVSLPSCDGAEAGNLTIGLAAEDEVAGSVRTSTLEIAVPDVTGDGEADATIGLAFADLPAAPSGSPFAGQTFRGRVRKTGAGMLRLTAANLHSGGTEVETGALEVDGSVPGAVTVAGGAFLGGVGTAESAALASGGGLCVRADGEATSVLTVGSFAAEDDVKVWFAGGRGRSFTYANRPVLKIAAKPQTLDLSCWRCVTDDGAAELTLAYDAASGIVSVSGTITVAAAAQGPVLGLVDGYAIDWSCDTLAATRDGAWSVPAAAEAQVSDGTLRVNVDFGADPVAFAPTQACSPCPRAVFDMTVGLDGFGVNDEVAIGEAAAAVIVKHKADGTAAYFAGTGEGWTELVGAVPEKGTDGLYTAHLKVEADEGVSPTRVSFTIDGTRMTDPSGRTWLPRSGTGSIRGNFTLQGEVTLGNVVARKSDTVNRFAESDGAGGWRYFGADGIAAVAAAGRRFFFALPAELPSSECYDTGLSASDVTSFGLSVFPTRGMVYMLSEVDGRWNVAAAAFPAEGLDFTVRPGERIFVNELPESAASHPLTVAGVPGEGGKEIFGGELVILGGSCVTPQAVRVGENARLTLLAALGTSPIDLGVAYGGLLDASAVAGGQSVGALEVDCASGFGSMCGTRLIDVGELHLADSAAIQALGRIPCDLTATENAAALIDWMFVVDGAEVSDKRHYAYDADARIVTWRNFRYPKDGLAGWTNLPMWGGGYMMNVVYTSDPNILYSYADVCGPYRSDDGGLSWQRLGGNLSLGARRNAMHVFRSLSVDPRDPDSVAGIAGFVENTFVGGFLVSRNGGKSWRKTGWTTVFSGVERTLGPVLSRDPNNPDVLIGGLDRYGIFLSRDNGETWTHTGLDERLFTCIHWDRNVANRVYACAKAKEPPKARVGGLFLSEDGGVTWRQIADEAPSELTQIDGDSRLVGIFDQWRMKTSTDGGFTWSLFENGLEIAEESQAEHHGNALCYSAIGCGTDFWLTGDGHGTMYRRGKGDSAWTRIAIASYATTDATGEIYEARQIKNGKAQMDALCSIIVDPRDDNHWFTTDWYTIWETTDAGAHFTSRNIGISQLCSSRFEADPLDANHLAYGVQDMLFFHSEDGGQTFKFYDTFAWGSYEGDSTHLALPAIAYSRTTPGLVFAASHKIGGGIGLAKSTDHGANWAALTCPEMPRRVVGQYGVHGVVCRGGDPEQVWACVGGEVGEGKGGPYVSTDGGATWTWKGQGMDLGKGFFQIDESRSQYPLHQLAFSSDGSGVACTAAGTAIYSWSEEEQKWTKRTLPGDFAQTWTAYEIQADPYTPGRYLIGCLHNIAESLDGGVTWRVFEGYVGEASKFSFDPHTPGLLVLACADAIRVSWDYGRTFDALPGGWAFASGSTTRGGSWPTCAQVTVDRKRLFIATDSQGVFQRNLTKGSGFLTIVK